MNLLAYLRVSTPTQVEEGQGLEVQRQEIEAWATANGHTIAAWHEDAGISGASGLDKRIGLGEALQALKTQEIDGLVVFKVDRLARDAMFQENLFRDIWKLGKQVLSTSAGECDFLRNDPKDPSRKLIRQILGAVSEYEKEMGSLRLLMGRLNKRRNGGYIGGTVPIGYKKNGRDIETDAAYQDMRNIITELRAKGSTLREISQVLQDQGFTQIRWHPQTVKRVLSRL